MLPAVTGASPRIAFNRVLLPPPLGPMIPTTCPRRMSACTPFRTTLRPYATARSRMTRQSSWSSEVTSPGLFERIRDLSSVGEQHSVDSRGITSRLAKRVPVKVVHNRDSGIPCQRGGQPWIDAGLGEDGLDVLAIYRFQKVRRVLSRRLGIC